MVSIKSRPCPARINAGRITAKRASQLVGLRLPQVVDFCRRKIIFGIHIDGKWWVSPAALPELRALVLPRPCRPFGVPGIFTTGGNL